MRVQKHAYTYYTWVYMCIYIYIICVYVYTCWPVVHSLSLRSLRPTRTSSSAASPRPGRSTNPTERASDVMPTPGAHLVSLFCYTFYTYMYHNCADDMYNSFIHASTKHCMHNKYIRHSLGMSFVYHPHVERITPTLWLHLDSHLSVLRSGSGLPSAAVIQVIQVIQNIPTLYTRYLQTSPFRPSAPPSQ